MTAHQTDQPDLAHEAIGFAFACFARFEDGSREMGWLAREESDRLQSWGESEPVTLRSGIFFFTPAGKQVGVVVIMFRIGKRDPWTPFTLDINPADEELDFLGALENQTRIRIEVHGGAGDAPRILEIKNPLRHFASEAIRRVALLPSWSRSDYVAACHQLYERFPDAQATLWRSLTPTVLN